jgi:cobalt-zinc-cadmium efflux system membrane fusion protein
MKIFTVQTTSIALLITLFTVFSFANQEASEDSHNHKHKPEYKPQYNTEQNNKHEEGISFSSKKMLLANIEVTELTRQTFVKSIYAPGEIKANGYTSYIISPRTESVIVSRHAILGEHVEKDQPLVTLFSESMADAQANYRVTYSEWQRIKKLSKGTISESRLLKTETEYNSALGRLTAFGLTQQAVNQIVKNNSSNLGEYTLVAKIAGAVLSDDFSQGQRVAPGDEIMILANEDNLWVEARVSPYKKLNLPIGTIAKIELGTGVSQLLTNYLRPNKTTFFGNSTFSL